jgi:transketolase
MDTKEFAKNMRKMILDAIYNSKSGHPGGALSCTDILAVLFNEEMNRDSSKPQDPERDRFVLSKGHACAALYAALALKGYFPVEEIVKFRKIDSFLEGHPEMKGIPGVDMTTGSLGQGISAACGMAISAKKNNKNYRVYAVLGDGELQEGQVWEASMFAAHYKLDNLCYFIDYNGLQIDGNITDVMSPLPIADKFRAFGLNVIEIDGHDYDQIRGALKAAKETKGKPTCVVAKTIKGKGVSFMENVASWHGTAPNKEQYEKAIEEVVKNG